MTDIQIRPATAAEFQTAIDWAASEGWNPGVDDLAVFHAADPDGFLMGFQNGEPVSSISVVRYGSDYGFLGFYIVRPDRRGTGAGVATWKAGMEYLADRTVGLDGVVDQQDNYRISGFVLAGRNVRYTGTPVTGDPVAENIRSPVANDLDAVAAYDRRHFPAGRSSFIRDWVLPVAPGVRRNSLIAWRDGGISGIGTVRECREGYKIGPLFADDARTAEALFNALYRSLPAESSVSLDVPEDNKEAVSFALRSGLSPVFETARMYRGAAPDLPIPNIFGITTFELG